MPMKPQIFGAGLAGLIAGAILAGIYLVIYAVSGGVTTAAGSAVLPARAALLYLAGGATGGIIVGILLPVTTSQLRALIAGVAALSPLVFASTYVYFGSLSWTSITGSIVISVGIGVVVGQVIFQELSD